MNKILLFKSLLLLCLWIYQPVFAESEPVPGDSILVNINTANAGELSSMLSGVGPSKAEAIIAYRTENGDFESVEDLLMVKGIGIKTLEENRSLLTVD